MFPHVPQVQLVVLWVRGLSPKCGSTLLPQPRGHSTSATPNRYTQPLHPTIACSHITMISRNKEEGNTQPWKGWCMGSEGRQRGEGDCVRRRGHTAETFRMVRENAFREGEKGGHSPPCTLKFRSSKKHKHRLSVL